MASYELRVEQQMDYICNKMQEMGYSWNYISQAILLYITKLNPNGFTRKDEIRNTVLRINPTEMAAEIVKHAVKYRAYQVENAKPVFLCADASKLSFSELTDPEAPSKCDQNKLLGLYYYFLESQRPEIIKNVARNETFYKNIIGDYVGMRYGKIGYLNSDLLDYYYLKNKEAQYIVSKIDEALVSSPQKDNFRRR